MVKNDAARHKELTITPETSTPPAAAKLLKLVETTLDDDKALDPVVIELTGKTDFADYLVIASGSSQRHVGAMSDHLRLNIKASGLAAHSIEGVPQCDWVLIDAGDVVVHLFRPDVRDFYNLEKLWGDSEPAGLSA